MNCLQFTLALLLFSFSVSNGQFQKMFGQQTVLDGHPGASDGKILIKSELDIKTTVSRICRLHSFGILSV